jgi:hypothetical protein
MIFPFLRECNKTMMDIFIIELHKMPVKILILQRFLKLIKQKFSFI